MSPPRLVLPAIDALRQLSDAGLPGAPVVDSDGAFIGSLHTAALADLTVHSSPTAAGQLPDAEAMTLPASRSTGVPVLDDNI